MITITLIKDEAAIEDEAAAQLRRGLQALLWDAVASGASVGYHHPIPDELNRDYWDGVLAQIPGGAHKLLVATDEAGTLVGSVQLALSTRPNGRHRAEVQKLLVLSSHRRRGIATDLMAAVEQVACDEGRTLLVLDTLKDNFGEPFYRHAGWIRAGEIPSYTIEVDGTFHPTVIFYKML